MKLKAIRRAPLAGPVAGLCVSAICVLAAAVSTPAQAKNEVVYFGHDPGAGRTDPHPDSTAGQANYLNGAYGYPGALSQGADHVIDFESVSTGVYHTLNLGSGVTMTGSDVFGGGQVVRAGASSTCIDVICGYNTTAGGANYLALSGGQVTFDFAKPIVAFSFMMGGVDHFEEATVDFPGEGQTYYVPFPFSFQAPGGLSFLGVVDPTEPFSSFTVNLGTDVVSLDDLHFTFAGEVPVTPPGGGGPGGGGPGGSGAGGVPEPSAWALMITGFGGLGAVLRRRRRGPALAWLELQPWH